MPSAADKTLADSASLDMIFFYVLRSLQCVDLSVLVHGIPFVIATA